MPTIKFITEIYPLPDSSIQQISVVVPRNPFVTDEAADKTHCLTALNVAKLIEWWPGKPHVPHRNPKKVRSIQRSLDWKRVVQIAAYLLQEEVTDARDRLAGVFSDIYDTDNAREWPPKVPKVVGYQPSSYPTFSNVLLHVNGAKVEINESESLVTGMLTFDEESKDLNFSVIDGQHRINGAYLALSIKDEESPGALWEIPAEIFLDLDEPGAAPSHQAQIFIDVNFNQKKVDRSLVADLFPTARSGRSPIGHMERAQDLGRKLMLDIGPLVGMIQIPGIKFGVKDVVTLATLNSAIEKVIPYMDSAGIVSLKDQAEFLAQCLEAWLLASGRKEDVFSTGRLTAGNVVYQGRVLVSFLTLVPFCVNKLIGREDIPWTSVEALQITTDELNDLIARAGLLGDDGKFLSKEEFKQKGYLGSGGIGRFRDKLWASTFSDASIATKDEESIKELADEYRSRVMRELSETDTNVDD